jgi:hypothetical protein
MMYVKSLEKHAIFVKVIFCRMQNYMATVRLLSSAYSLAAMTDEPLEPWYWNISKQNEYEILSRIWNMVRVQHFEVISDKFIVDRIRKTFFPKKSSGGSNNNYVSNIFTIAAAIKERDPSWI